MKKISKQDLQRATKETYEPVAKSLDKAQKKTDEKQDKMIEQLQENRVSITNAIDILSGSVFNKDGTRGLVK